jgi:hypothetical protein
MAPSGAADGRTPAGRREPAKYCLWSVSDFRSVRRVRRNDETGGSPGLSALELQQRLVFSLLKPAVRLCRRFRLPLKQFEALCRLAYFEELRRKGEMTHAEMARVFGTSLRTIGHLERQYRGNFFTPEDEEERRRRVEAVLRDGPATAAAIAAALREPAEEVEPLLQSLRAAGRVLADGGTWRLDPAFRSLVRADFDARVDGLNHQLEVVVEALRCRFLGGDGPSVARTLSFVGRPEDVERFCRELVRVLRDGCGEAEEAALAEGAADRREFAVTLALAPARPEGESR